MRNILVVSQNGSILSTISTNDATLVPSDNEIYREIDEKTFNKIRENPRYFTYIHNQLVEATDSQKRVIDQQLQVSLPKPIDRNQQISDLQKRVTILEEKVNKLTSPGK